MQEASNANSSGYIFAIISALPSVFCGLVMFSTLGVTLTNVTIVLLMLLFSILGGLFLRYWHLDQLDSCKSRHLTANNQIVNKLFAYTAELETLIKTTAPKISEQVMAARELTEQEISILIRRFTTMLQELEQILEYVNQSTSKQLPNDVENLRSNATKIRNEIDFVLESLQFQDRVSQILTMVEENLSMLQKTVEKNQKLGNERNADMINVNEMMATIQTKYDTVIHLPNRSMSEHVTNEATIF